MLTGKAMDYAYKLSSPRQIPGFVVSVLIDHVQLGNDLAVSPAETAYKLCLTMH